MKISASNLIFGTALAIACAVVAVLGFREAGSPDLRGKVNRDEQRADDLRAIVRSIRHEANGSKEMAKWKKIPATLSEVKFSTYGEKPGLIDPLTRKPYEYRRLTDYSYEICMDFELDSKSVDKLAARSYRPHPAHGVGRTCFKIRINDPDQDWL